MIHFNYISHQSSSLASSPNTDAWTAIDLYFKAKFLIEIIELFF